MTTALTLIFLLFASLSSAQITCLQVGTVYSCHGTPQTNGPITGAVITDQGITPFTTLSPAVPRGVQPLTPLNTLESLPTTPRPADPFLDPIRPTIIAPIPLGGAVGPLE